jgi:signal transduction histidine kinase
VTSDGGHVPVGEEAFRSATAGDRGFWLRVAISLAFVSLALLLRWAVDPWLGDYLPLPPLYGAVALAVWLCGYLPASIAAVLGFFGCNFLFGSPRGQFFDATVQHWIGFFFYLISCALIIGIGEGMRTARVRAERRRIRLAEEVAHRKETEAALARELATVKEQEAAIERAAEDLRRSNQDLEQFALIASHDLRTPTNSIAGLAGMLKREYGPKLGAEANEMIALILDCTARMDRLIADLLTYSRLKSIGHTPAPVPASDALDWALVSLRGAVRESGAELHLEPLPTVMADSMQLAQVFQNLIGNAIKFRRSSVPHIHVDATQADAATWEFRVQDNGIGIPPDQVERVFQLFQRVDHGPERPGNGIGLAICRKIVERHGGRIWIDSVEGEGTTVRFTLPIMDSNCSTSREPPESAHTSVAH